VVAGARKGDGVAADAAEGVEDGGAAAALGDLVGDLFGRDGVPALGVEEAAVVVAREQPLALREVCGGDSGR
jgi:hypothetical protein